MKAFAFSTLAAAIALAASPSTAQKIIGPEKPQAQPSGSQAAMPGAALKADLQPPGIKPALAGPGGGPHTALSLAAALAASGKFNTFLSLLKVAGWDGDGKTGFADGSVRGVTVLAPDDAAFAAMDKSRLAALMSDREAARGFVMAHVVGQPLKVNDLFYAENPTSVKLFQSAKGDPLKLLCDGRAHVGLHHPRINDGMARVGDVQDVAFSGGMIQEIDGVLAN